MRNKKSFLFVLFLGVLLLLCCGFVLMRHAMTFSFSESYIEEKNSDAHYIYFGSYPQSQVKDINLIEKLNSLPLDWKSYGYYNGNGTVGSAVQSDYMCFADVEYSNEKYRAIKLSDFRAHLCHQQSSKTTQQSYDIALNSVYWYRYEPIRWIVLSSDDNLLLSDMVLDSQPIENVIYIKQQKKGLNAPEFYKDPDFKIIAADYYTSDIRQWLNSTFINSAFSEAETEGIIYTDLGNSTPHNNKTNAEDFNDRIFLLSYAEATDPKNGFSSRPEKHDQLRLAYPTDYAKSQGNWTHTNGACYWWLRSAVKDSTPKGATLNSAVNFEGCVCCAYYLPYSPDGLDTGIRPAVRLVQLDDLVTDIPNGDN
ncbi:MAG: hypothetical protein IJM45_02315 [Clostridia bacterium]|nr:hypothetical protein [Clostridia bacterium]